MTWTSGVLELKACSSSMRCARRRVLRIPCRRWPPPPAASRRRAARPRSRGRRPRCRLRAGAPAATPRRRPRAAAHQRRQLVEQATVSARHSMIQVVARLDRSLREVGIARHDHAGVEQQAAVAVLGQAGQRVDLVHLHAGPLKRLEQRVREPLRQLVERHPAGVGRRRRRRAGCGHTSPSGVPCSDWPLGQMPLSVSSNTPSTRAAATWWCDAARSGWWWCSSGAWRWCVSASNRWPGWPSAVYTCGCARSASASRCSSADAAFEADQRVVEADLEHLGQRARVERGQRLGIDAQRIAGVRREAPGHEGAEARHAPALRSARTSGPLSRSR